MNDQMRAASPEAVSSSTKDDVLLRVEDLRISMSGTGVVHQASFDVHKGEVVAIVGESGAGKSMTAMAIPQLLPPGGECSGSIRFDGNELLETSDRAMRRIRGAEVACVYQEPMTALNPLHTIGDFLEEAIGAHVTPETRSRARTPQELLEAVGLGSHNGILERYPHQLSGGQRQRVMAAGAVAWKPKLLIADEPTTALDVTTQRQMLTMFRQLVEQENMAMIFVTHDMGVVADIADSIVVMRHGEVVETGDVFSVFADPQHEYTRMLLGAAQTLHGASDTALTVTDSSSPPEKSVGVAVLEANAPATEPALVTSELTIQYQQKRTRRRRTAPETRAAVNRIALEVSRGETLGIVGESGSGKSTIARSILGLTPITSGIVTLGGIEMTGQSRRDRRQTLARVGAVFQDPTSSLDPSLPLWRIVTEPLWRGGTLRDRRKLRAQAAELLSDVDLDPTWIERRRHQLSGGQRQRVAIARAIAHRPDVLIADEPTSALDVTVQVKVLDLLARLQKEHNFACVFISHDLYVVSTVSDRILVMKDGEAVETGRTVDVLGSPSSEYTRALIGAIPLPDPVKQRARRNLAQSSETSRNSQ
ncbi:dipeptide ABC transporter ATP-binding protein [Paramicrobacterium chengjingii]|uniref:dipeptide ABC transporter ATP-binding protein n=1 Tax=Paramicrobacterium chengjingii TaxID=2769067 RepID=UPI001AB03E38|nr:ABC transporter ATP-binding protein [Microbacterium chengjingii]